MIYTRGVVYPSANLLLPIQMTTTSLKKTHGDDSRYQYQYKYKYKYKYRYCDKRPTVAHSSRSYSSSSPSSSDSDDDDTTTVYFKENDNGEHEEDEECSSSPTEDEDAEDDDDQRDTCDITRLADALRLVHQDEKGKEAPSSSDDSDQSEDDGEEIGSLFGGSKPVSASSAASGWPQLSDTELIYKAVKSFVLRDLEEEEQRGRELVGEERIPENENPLDYYRRFMSYYNSTFAPRKKLPVNAVSPHQFEQATQQYLSRNDPSGPDDEEVKEEEKKDDSCNHDDDGKGVPEDEEDEEEENKENEVRITLE